MTKHKSDQNISPTQTSTHLLSEGKSTRLQKMREQAMAVKPLDVKADADISAQFNTTTDPEWLTCRQLIDRRLADVFAVLPAGKQRSLFKIRYGMTPEQLRKMSIRDILSVLKLTHLCTVSMKHMADVDYNGRLINK